MTSFILLGYPSISHFFNNFVVGELSINRDCDFFIKKDQSALNVGNVIHIIVEDVTERAGAKIEILKTYRVEEYDSLLHKCVFLGNFTDKKEAGK